MISEEAVYLHVQQVYCIMMPNRWWQCSLRIWMKWILAPVPCTVTSQTFWRPSHVIPNTNGFARSLEVCVDINAIHFIKCGFVLAEHVHWCVVSPGVQLIKPYWYSDRKYSHVIEMYWDSMMMIYVWICNAEHEPWVFFRGAEYYFGSNPFPWESVSFACKIMGADLLSVHSSDELDFIKGRLKKVRRYRLTPIYTNLWND